MNDKPERRKITLYTDDYIEDFLQELHSRPIRKYIAEILELQYADKCIIYVQRADHEGIELVQPVLWWYKYWKDSVEDNRRQKAQSHKRRVDSFLLEKNVKLVSRILMRDFFMDEQSAKNASYKMILKKQVTKLKAFGVERLYDKESDL